MAPHELVELVREQPPHPADPRIRRFRHDRVVPGRLRREERLRIVDDDARARIGVGELIPRPELLGAAHHLALDFDGVDLGQPGVREQEVRRDAGSESDARDPPCIRVHGKWHRRQQRHGRLVAGRKKSRVGTQLRVRLAVGADAAPRGQFILHHADARRLAVPLKQHAIRSRVEQRAVAVHTRRHLVRVQVREEEGDGHRRGARNGERPWHSAVGERRPRRPKQRRAQSNVERATEREQPLETEQRQPEVHRAEHAGDRADRVRRVDGSDARLAVAALHEVKRDERQRRARAERGGQHDRHGDRVVPQVEDAVAVLVVRHVQHHPAHHVEALPVQEQGSQREHAHRHLQVREHAYRRCQPVDAALDPGPSQREPEDEGAQHQLERVRRRAQHEGEHAQPGDLVHER